MSVKSALDLIRPDEEFIDRLENTLTERACNKNTTRKMRLCISAGMAIMIFLCCFMYRTYQKPVALVCLDINPSMELEINCFDRIVNINCLNSDAVKLLQDKKLRGKKLSKAINIVITAASNNGYIENDKTTYVSVFVNSKKETAYSDILNEFKNEIYTSNKNIEIISDMITDELIEEASQISISTGKLKIIKMIQQLDSNASINDYKDYSMTSLIQRLVYLVSDENTEADRDTKVTIRKELSSLGVDIDRVTEEMKDSEDGEKISNKSDKEAPIDNSNTNMAENTSNDASSNSNSAEETHTVIGGNQKAEPKSTTGTTNETEVAREVTKAGSDTATTRETAGKAEAEAVKVREAAKEEAAKAEAEAAKAREAAAAAEKAAKEEAAKAEAEAAKARELAAATEKAAKEEAAKAEAETAKAREAAAAEEKAAKEEAAKAEAEAAKAREAAEAAEKAAKEEAAKAEEEAAKAREVAEAAEKAAKEEAAKAEADAAKAREAATAEEKAAKEEAAKAEADAAKAREAAAAAEKAAKEHIQ